MTIFLRLVLSAAIAGTAIATSGCDIRGPVGCGHDSVPVGSYRGYGELMLHYKGALTGVLETSGRTPANPTGSGLLDASGVTAESRRSMIDMPAGADAQVLAAGTVQYGMHQVTAGFASIRQGRFQDQLNIEFSRVDLPSGDRVVPIVPGQEFRSTPTDLYPSQGPFPQLRAAATLRLGYDRSGSESLGDENDKLFSSTHDGAEVVVTVTSIETRDNEEIVSGRISGRLLNRRGEVVDIDDATFTVHAFRTGLK